MSVVGPAPTCGAKRSFMRERRPQTHREAGITGYASVYGRNSLPWHDRLALDVHFVRNVSFPLDVKVFFKTFSAVFNQEGVFVEDGSEK
ncbi:MAG: sugar transferase [Eggerthella lenta]